MWGALTTLRKAATDAAAQVANSATDLLEQLDLPAGEGNGEAIEEGDDPGGEEIENDLLDDEQDPEQQARRTNELAREILLKNDSAADLPDTEEHTNSFPVSAEKAVLEAATNAAQNILSDIMSFTGVANGMTRVVGTL